MEYPTPYSAGFYLSLTSRSPSGPFTIVNRNISMTQQQPAIFCDFDLLCDDDGTAYIIYTIWRPQGLPKQATHMSVEQLSGDYTASALKASPVFTGPAASGDEAPVLFRRKGVVYAMFGHGCCFCAGGSGVNVFTAAHPLGPFTKSSYDIGCEHAGDNIGNCLSVVRAQQNCVFNVETSSGPQIIWTGDRWMSAPDHKKGHDMQYWTPLSFDDSASPPKLKRLQWIDKFDLSLKSDDDATLMTTSLPGTRLRERGAPRNLCNLQGNWTSGPNATGELVHIEILQAPGSSDFSVAAPWVDHAGFATAGKLLPDGRVAVFMIEPGNAGGVWTLSNVSTSLSRNPDRVPCTLVYNWCRMPYCSEALPAKWPPWPAHPRPVPIAPMPWPVPITPPLDPEPLISCGDNASIHCGVPAWQHTWDLARSTALMACNLSGVYDPVFAARWGLVSFDALNQQADWLAVTPHDSEERMVEQCRLVKSVDNSTRCMVYRNTALALQWLSTQRSMMNAAHAFFFLRFQDSEGSTAEQKCDAAGPCTYAPEPGRPPYSGAGALHGGPFCCPFGNASNVYCEMGGTTVTTHWRGQEQFLWNFSEPALRAWWVTNFFSGKGGTESQYVDGCFSDDVMGVPEEHPDAVARLGMTAAQLTQLQRDTQQTWNLAAASLIEEGGYSWQLFGVSDYAAAPPSDKDPAACTAQMREYCRPARQELPMLMGLHGNCARLGYTGNAPLESCTRGTNFTLAAFLVVRPPHGYVGSGWLGCDALGKPPVHVWEPLFDLDVGEPAELCQERKPGVFSRTWSKGSAALDCNTLEPTLRFGLKSDDDTPTPTTTSLRGTPQSVPSAGFSELQNTKTGPIDAWTARWNGAVGEPFETPWSTRKLWREQGCPLSCHLDWNDGFTLMPRGPLLGQGDLGMTVISEQLPECSPAPGTQWCAPMPVPGSPGSGNISLQLGSNQLWAISDNDWSKCHYTEAVCKANGQSIDLVNETGNGLGCWPGWLPGCRHSFPRRVGFGGESTL